MEMRALVLTTYVKISVVIATFLFLTLNFAQDAIFVGVKEGDWIEYIVSTSGTPPAEIEVTWAKMEIMHVQDTMINANVTTKAANETFSNRIMTFNLTRGQVGAWFIVPAGLNPGDRFWDCSLGRNVTVEGEELLNFAGATRAVTNATTSQRLKYWDKATGVFVECIDVLDEYSINATAVRTNMWGSEGLEGQQISPYGIPLVAVLAVVAVVVVIAIGRTKLKN